MAQFVEIKHPKTGIIHKFQTFPKTEVKRYFVILDNRSIHPTVYVSLQNAIVALSYLINR